MKILIINNTVKVIVIFCFFMMAPGVINITYCDDTVLSLNSYIDRLYLKSEYFSLLIQKQKESQSKVEYSKKGRELTVSVEPYSTLSESPSQSPSYIETNRTTETGIRAGVSKNIWVTGTSIEASTQTARSNIKTDDKLGPVLAPVLTPDKTPETTSTTKRYTSIYSVRAVQPLLQNFRGTLFRMESDLAEFDSKISKISLRDREEEFLYKAIKTYVEWVEYRKLRAIVYNRINLAKRLLNQSTEMANKNLITKSDLLQVQEELETARAEYSDMDIAVQASEEQLKYYCGQEDSGPLSTKYDLSINYNLPEDANTEFCRNIQVLRYAIKKSDRALKGYENMALPQFDVVAQASLSKSNSSFSKSIKADKKELYGGFLLTYPLGTHEASGHIKEMKSVKKQLISQITLAKKERDAELMSLKKEYKITRNIIKINQRRLEAANLRSHRERDRFEKGSGDIFRYLSARKEVEGVRMILWRNRAKLHKIYYHYLNTNDTLLAEFGKEYQ